MNRLEIISDLRTAAQEAAAAGKLAQLLKTPPRKGRNHEGANTPEGGSDESAAGC